MRVSAASALLHLQVLQVLLDLHLRLLSFVLRTDHRALDARPAPRAPVTPAARVPTLERCSCIVLPGVVGRHGC
jgi:hypothetical protein